MSSDPRPPRLIAWAAEQLDVAPSAGLDEVKRAFRRRVAAADFTPSLECREGFLALRAAPTAERDAGLHFFMAAERERLRKDVEDFAERFFDLPPNERRARWEALLAASGDHADVSRRLAALEEGLEVDLRDVAGPLAELASRCAQLFTLAPAARAEQRRKLLRRFDGESAEARSAARRLAQMQPAVAALAPELIHPLVEGGGTRRRSSAHRRQWRAAVKVSWIFERSSARRSRPASSAWMRPVAIIVVVVAGNAVRMGCQHGRESNSFPSPQSRRAFELPPAAAPHEMRDGRIDFDELDRFLHERKSDSQVGKTLGEKSGDEADQAVPPSDDSAAP